MYPNPPLESVERVQGSVYIGVATSPVVIGKAQRSIMSLARRDGDAEPVFGEFTKGAEAREHHTRQFLDSEHDFILYLDGDMELPPDGLERLRSHGLPCVTGLAFRRGWQPMLKPAWYEDDPEFNWPMMPFRYTPEGGHLYRLGATGFFCWLIHRSVFEAVEPLLKGERFVLEDDMDVWPYDLKAVLEGREKLRPLRATKDRIGADLRLGFFIRQAGFTLWGDPNVHCGHYVNYPLGIRDWVRMAPGQLNAYAEETTRALGEFRQRQTEQIAEVTG